ncbi:hypothetical protein CFC21_072471 [Triticum aestivum]|uniref:Transmembrane protein n=2 Tax=Triticum aestivum TaxID=4565 RepID=A0A9R1HJZ8_WHEAT|nr:hypothetical protein CFC21_072470 [Triticum aestivum]KAF7066489.1 hypothetical protein CFC21_072471 [Triticum aestivum]
MEGLKPIVLVNSLKTVEKAVILWHSNRSGLRLVLVGLFLLNLALTAAMVKLARQPVNLDSVRPFFEIAVNSTTTGVGAGADASLSWQPRSFAHVGLGEFFTVLSMSAAIISFSYTRNRNLPDNGSRRKFKRLCSLLFAGIGMFFYVSAVVDYLDLDDRKSRYFQELFEFLYMLTIVVASKEYTSGLLSAANKACLLAGGKFLEIIVLGTMTLVVQDSLDDIYVDGMHLLYRKEQEETSDLRKGTVAKIFLISIAPALLTLVLQVFQCSVILAFYGDGRLPEEQQGDGNDSSDDGGSDGSSSDGGKKTT